MEHIYGRREDDDVWSPDLCVWTSVEVQSGDSAVRVGVPRQILVPPALSANKQCQRQRHCQSWIYKAHNCKAFSALQKVDKLNYFSIKFF